MKDLFDQVEANINFLAGQNVWWSGCASQGQMAAAKEGRFSLPLGIKKPVPPEWIRSIRGRSVLCLAGAGGLQAPLLAAAGADVTVVDLSESMLEKDRLMAEKYRLSLRLEHGNMIDLSVFQKESFDYIVNPVSLCYVPDVSRVFRECHRVLKKGGALILAAPNPVNYLCDFIEDETGGYYKAVHRMPYFSGDHADQGSWIEYGHTMENYIGGLTECGFVIDGYTEDQGEDITELFFMLRAVKR